MSNNEFNSDSSLGRMVKNGAYIAFQFGIYTLSGLFFIPFLVHQYGSGSYGLIALAGFLTQYVGIISQCVGNAIARFLNIALNRNEWDKANEIFSTALVANILLMVLEVPIFTVGIVKLDWIIGFPPEVATDFRLLVICNILVFFISILSGVIRTPILAANRLDISATLDSVRLGFRLLLLFSLIKIVGAKLWIIGVVDLGLALTHFSVLCALCRKFAKHLRFGWKHVSAQWVRPVLSMAGWSIVTSLGGYMLVQTDVWMINRFVSESMAGIYAAILVWPNFLRQISKQLATVVSPVYMIDYAKGNKDRVALVSLSASKLLGCFTALAVGVMCVIAGPLLRLWLGVGAEEHIMLFRIMIVYLVFVIGEAVLWQIFVTLNKVYFSGIVALSAGVLNIILSLSFIRAGFGAIGVAVATAISTFLACGVAIPFGVCREFKISYRIPLINHLSATLLMAVSAVVTTVVINFFSYSIVYSAGALVLLLAASGALVYYVILSGEERMLVQRFLKKVRLQLGCS